MIVLSWARRRLAPFFTLPWVPKSLIGLVTFVALLVIATLPYVPERQVLRSGDVAKKDIEAPRTVDYVDPEQTAIRRRIAAGRVEPVYRESPDATAAARTAVTTAFEAIVRVHAMTGLTEAERAARLRQQAGVPLSPAVAAAALALEPVRVRILRGEIIVRRGDRITETHLRKLEALGLIGVPTSWDIVLGTAVVIALLLGLTAYYQFQYQPEIWRTNRYLLLWSLLVILTVLLARAVVSLRLNLNLIPAAAGSILLTVLLRPRLALVSAAVLSILIGLIATSDLRTAFIAFTGGVVGVYAIRRISHRTDLIVAGLKVGLATAAAVIATGLLERQPVYPAMVVDASSGIFNGVIVGLFSIGIMPYLENLFGLVTPIKLLELSNPAHPLLRRLQLEAPGTYHHSVIVGNLAEAAAEAIGADALLVRVGTYYHDIGKIRRPVFFVENQVGVDNPHERMAPSLSALTVAAHVRDGLELAREYGLPRVITDFIPEHHGTMLMAYFYHQALERGDQPEPGAYRYEGPKPQTRETAVVMLADAVEAAVRTLPRPTPDRIYEVVRRIVHERLEDGQLDECDLMFRDLEKIAQAFTRILTGIFHPRVEYPDLERDLRPRRRERVGRDR